MKKIYLFFVFILVFSIFSFYSNIEKGKILGVKKKNIQVPTPTTFTMPENTVEVTEGEKTYWVTWVKVESKDKLFLYPNFKEKDSARNLVDKKKCKKLVNGSYYTKDEKPLGLFISDGIPLKEKTISTLMPVVFYVSSDNNDADIVYNLTNIKARIAVQVGPVLIEEGKAKKLSIRQDESTRRVVLALTDKKEIVFLTVYGAGMNYEGPYLTNLPDLLVQFREKTGINLFKAVNLDGGSAAAFYTGTFFLEELSYIGSYFCIL